MDDSKTTLNLGCGDNALAGAVNHDRCPFASHIDVCHDLDIIPWPWGANSFDRIVAIDVLEHLRSFLAFFDECWRILRPGGMAEVRVPRWDHVNTVIDPTHLRGYHPESFDYLDPSTQWGRKYAMYTPHKWTKVAVQDQGDNIVAVLQVRKDG